MPTTTKASVGRQPIDMTGVESGTLIYVRETTVQHQPRHVVALCRNAEGGCGQECEVNASNLRRGLTTRCPTCRTAAHNLKGRTFGKLKVVRPLTKRASNGAVVWRCECECGKTADVSTSNLTTTNEVGATRTCGRC